MYNCHQYYMKGLTCCNCLKPLTDQEHNNVIQTECIAYWSYPVLEDPFDHEIYALGFPCNDCLQENRPVIRVPEYVIKDKKIRYHLIEHLKMKERYLEYMRMQEGQALEQLPEFAQYLAALNSTTQNPAY